MSDTLTQKKDLLRRKILLARDALSPKQRLHKSRSISARLLSLPDVRDAGSFFIYVSFRSEVATHELLRLLLEHGKTVSVPLTDRKNSVLIPFLITHFDHDLQSGYMGIREPKPDRCKRLAIDAIDLVITPGAVFSEDGRRIGYGGGYYDRFLAACSAKAYGLAYELQVAEEVPHAPRYDMPMNCIITEDRTICCTDV